MKIIIAVLLLSLQVVSSAKAQDPNADVSQVYVIFKTHLDIGFTQLPSKVEQRYIKEFIPKAIDVAQKLIAEGGEERYVWTTGSWLVSSYLRQASPEAVERLEAAIARGDIAWNGVPYTVEAESMSKELFATTLNLSKQLDRRFGKKTSAAKMTDVPGHSIGVVAPLCDADMTFLQIGVNCAATVPNVPPICLWRDGSNKEIVLMYQKAYGADMILPNGKSAVSINFTNDNMGPHSVQEVKAIFASLRQKYPNARIVASSLNEVAEELQTMKSLMPVVTAEIGDTWIYGYASSPIRMAKYRAVSRLYTKWIKTGRIKADSPEAVDFAVRLGMIAEHTWGLDVKVFLNNWDKYDVDIFNASRDLPEFRMVEESWREKDANIEKAIALLPKELQNEANAAISDIGTPAYKKIEGKDKIESINNNGAYKFSANGVNLLMGEVAYQTYDCNDYKKFQEAYLMMQTDWAYDDNGKRNLENTKAQSATVSAVVENCSVDKKKQSTNVNCKLAFPADKRIDTRMLPEEAQLEYLIPASGDYVEMNVTIHKKPAVRLPEAYWVSFIPSQVTSVMAQKMGYEIDVLDVVEGGNRQMHGIEDYIDIVTDKGRFRITSFDVPLVAIGERSSINYSTNQPRLKDGIHFCLFNNLWGTNFNMWFEGSVKYRFKVELI